MIKDKIGVSSMAHELDQWVRVRLNPVQESDDGDKYRANCIGNT